MSALKNVLLIGASGNVGKHILKALTNDPYFTVSVLSRANSKATFPSTVKVHRIDSSYPEKELLQIFKGQDAVVSAIATAHSGDHSRDSAQVPPDQKHLIDNAVRAGVKRFVPADFGSDSENKEALKLVHGYQTKNDVKDYLISKESDSFTWTSFANGPFLDWGLQNGFLGYDIKNRTATIYDDGNVPWTATMLPIVGLAVANSLKKPEKSANKKLFISSLRTNQNEVLAAFEKATDSKWTVKHVSFDENVKEGRELIAKGNSNGVFNLIIANVYCDFCGSDFTKSGRLADDWLELPRANIQEVVDELVKA